MSNRILEVSLDGGQTFQVVDSAVFRVYTENTLLLPRYSGEITGEQVMVQHKHAPWGHQEFIEML